VFVVPVAIVIAGPFAWWLFHNWLSRYASRIDLGVMSFAVPAILVVVISLLTVASQAIKAGRADPAVVIREIKRPSDL
jgi:putative ABC transport system permease protein